MSFQCAFDASAVCTGDPGFIKQIRKSNCRCGIVGWDVIALHHAHEQRKSRELSRLACTKRCGARYKLQVRGGKCAAPINGCFKKCGKLGASHWFQSASGSGTSVCGGQS